MIIIKNKLKVLIADDEFTIRNGLNKAVLWDSLNMQVVGLAKDGQEALEMIHTYRPDIVITDIRMPKLDGIQLIEESRQAYKDLQFIILSGHNDFSYAQQAIRYGVKAYLLKPLRLAELIAELKVCSDNIKIAYDKGKNYGNIEMELYKEDSKKLFLNQLIQNEIMSDEKINSKIQSSQMTIKDEPVQVIVFELKQTNIEISKESIEKVIEIIKEVFTDFKNEVWQYNHFQIIAIINTESIQTNKSVHEYCQECFEKFRLLDEIPIIVGIGDKEETLKRSYYSFTKALSALTYKLYDTTIQIYNSQIICSKKPEISANNVDVNPLVEYIRKGEKEKVSQYCKEFFNILFYVPMPPPSYIKGMCIYLVSDVQKTLKSNYQIVIDELYIKVPFTDLGHITTLDLMEEYIVEYFNNLSEWIREDMLSQPDSIIIAAKQYIDCNFKNKISATDVANYVNLSVAYFTVYFKTNAGINFRDYLLGKKMDYAKQLLITSNLSISEVGNSVGYDDYRSFYRAFKNHTGETPSEFVGSK